jgi:hypothetical protein
MVDNDRTDLVLLKYRVQTVAEELANVPLTVRFAAKVGEGRINH